MRLTNAPSNSNADDSVPHPPRSILLAPLIDRITGNPQSPSGGNRPARSPSNDVFNLKFSQKLSCSLNPNCLPWPLFSFHGQCSLALVFSAAPAIPAPQPRSFPSPCSASNVSYICVFFEHQRRQPPKLTPSLPQSLLFATRIRRTLQQNPEIITTCGADSFSAVHGKSTTGNVVCFRRRIRGGSGPPPRGG